MLASVFPLRRLSGPDPWSLSPPRLWLVPRSRQRYARLDDPLPARPVLEARGGERVAERPEEARRHGEVEEDVALRAELPVEVTHAPLQPPEVLGVDRQASDDE